jgi:hypothetical protein
MIDFPHNPPEGYSYETKEFKRNVVSIWIHHLRKFDYNLGDHVACIWGFYNTKTKQYHAPVNSQTVGSVVDIRNTTAYSAMVPKQTPLESAFV